MFSKQKPVFWQRLLPALPTWVFPLVAVILGLVGYWVIRPPNTERISTTSLTSRSDPSISLRILNWNLENFSGYDWPSSWSEIQVDRRSSPKRTAISPDRYENTHDISAIQTLVQNAGADIVVFQEVRAPDAIRKYFPAHGWQFTQHGGRGQQFLALGVRTPSDLSCNAAPDIEAISAEGQLRPALHAHCIHQVHGRFDIIVVHLKSGARGHDQRQQQWRYLWDELSRNVSGPLFIVGDFNFAGSETDSGSLERINFGHESLLKASLREVELNLPCTSYWSGKPDNLLEPSALDGAWERGFIDDRHTWSARVLGHCAQASCSTIEGSVHDLPSNMVGLSDHCPIVFDLRVRAP